LKKELEKRKFEVKVPKMPNPSKPVIRDWVSYLSKIAVGADSNTYFVGHSVGCQAILRYLEKSGKSVGGAVFVAGWFTLKNLETIEEKAIAKPWIETPIDLYKVRRTARNFTAILSNNDPFVPFKRTKRIFEGKLGAKIIAESKKGHFTDDDGVTELPSALESVLKMSAKKKK
jgi:hypothetical protein